MAILDLATLDTTQTAENGATMILEHPVTGEALESTLTLAGADSATYRRAMDASLKRRTKRPGKLTLDDITNESVETMARCTLGWSGMMVDGESLPFSTDNARMVYRRFSWIREQADAFTSDRAHYLQD